MTPKSVLIVDDDPLTQRALEQLLSPHVGRGLIEVRWAEGAESALVHMQERRADLVVCELNLPGRDGVSLGEALRGRAHCRLFLMGAGHIDPALRARAKALDALVFGKPLELPELVAAMAGTIDRNVGRASSALPELGSLSERAPSRLLLDLWEERRSGLLHLVRGRVHKQVTLRKGAPVFVTSNLRAETLGHFLVQRGRITDAQHQQAVTQAQREDAQVGRVLVRLGMLQEHELLDELAAQLRYKLVAALRWPDGEYRFIEGEPGTDRLELPFESPQLVFSGLGRTARLDEIVARLRAEPARLCLTLRAERHRADFSHLFGPDGIALFDRRPLIAELLAHREAGSLLVQADVLLCSSLAELEALAPGVGHTPARDPLALVELGRDRSSARAPAPRSSKEGLFTDDESEIFTLPRPEVALTHAERVALDPDGENLRREILGEYLSLHAKTHYQLFCVARDVAAQEVSLAHDALCEKFALERFDQADLGRDHGRLEEIVARIRVAYDVLSSPERRAEYDRALASSPQLASPSDGRLSAEVLSHEGQFRLERGDHIGARKSLQLAVEADGDQPDYHALLGWATYLTALGPGRESAPPDRIRAAALLAAPHLEIALSIEPDHLDAHDFWGRIEAAQGNDASAVMHLELVLDQASTRAEALVVLEGALARGGQWRRLEQLYRRLIHRLADDDSERPLRIWSRLADLYRTRLSDLDAAKVAYKTVARLAPDDPRPRLALAELLHRDATARGPEAHALREAWQLAPEDAGPGLRLYRAYRDSARSDAALVTAMALACRGIADEDATHFMHAHRPNISMRAEGPLSDSLFASLRAPEDNPLLLDIFAAVFSVSAPELALYALEVGPADLQRVLPEPFSTALAYVAHTLSVPTPLVYVRKDFGSEIHVGASSPLILLVGAKALLGADPHALLFRLGRALSYLRGSRALVAALPASALKDHLGAALTLAHPGTRVDDPEGRVAHLRARLAGRASSLARTLSPMFDALLATRRESIHLGRLIAGMARTADRVGLLLGADLLTAARIVGEESVAGAEDELVTFALDEAHLQARVELGLAVSA